MQHEKLYNEAVGLLTAMIATPSASGEESITGDLVWQFLRNNKIRNIERKHNNVWARNLHFDPSRPTILLNSHHDTVRPNVAYTRDPYDPDVEGDKLYGLGSNDAGASVVALLAAFAHFYSRAEMKYNIIIAMSGEEEINGPNGLESIIPELGLIDFAIVGEPTGMQMAIAERGLIVLDCIASGRAGHAAREEGENAIYKAMRDIEWVGTYKFPMESELFGAVKMTVTVIEAGTQHNVVPAECRFTIDVRSIEKYTNEEIVEIIRKNLQSEVKPRSTRLKPSSISIDHPIVQAGKKMGLTTFGSPTTSDQAVLNCPSLKMGVGDSARSHSADEYVLFSEIREGIRTYINLLELIL